MSACPGSEHLLNLLLTHLDECPLGELLVHLWLVQDVLGPAGVLQGAQGLLCGRRPDRWGETEGGGGSEQVRPDGLYLQVGRGGGHGGNDGGLGPSPQRVLQNPGQL